VCPSAVPEFEALVGNDAAAELRCGGGGVAHAGQVLKKCFTRMMNCEKKVFVDRLNMLVKRITEEGEQSLSVTRGQRSRCRNLTCAFSVACTFDTWELFNLIVANNLVSAA